MSSVCPVGSRDLRGSRGKVDERVRGTEEVLRVRGVVRRGNECGKYDPIQV